MITGAGKGFCAGQDLREFSELSGSIGDALEETYHPNIRLIRALEKPVLAAVNGPAGGSRALARNRMRRSRGFRRCDVRAGLHRDRARSRLGWPWFIHRLLGFARAFEWMSSNRKLTADEALAWGLVSEVIPPDGFPARVAELAADWAARPTWAVGMTKRLFEHAHAAGLEAQLELEAQLQQAAIATDDFGEGVAAFLAKRPPSFTGR